MSGCSAILGETGNLGVIVRNYEPKVNCITPPGQATHIDPIACQPILQTLPVSTEEQTFSSLKQQGVRVQVPLYFTKG